MKTIISNHLLTSTRSIWDIFRPLRSQRPIYVKVKIKLLLFKEPQAVVKHKALQPGCIVSKCSVTFSTLNEHILQTFRLRTVYF